MILGDRHYSGGSSAGDRIHIGEDKILLISLKDYGSSLVALEQLLVSELII